MSTPANAAVSAAPRYVSNTTGTTGVASVVNQARAATLAVRQTAATDTTAVDATSSTLAAIVSAAGAAVAASQADGNAQAAQAQAGIERLVTSLSSFAQGLQAGQSHRSVVASRQLTRYADMQAEADSKARVDVTGDRLERANANKAADATPPTAAAAQDSAVVGVALRFAVRTAAAAADADGASARRAANDSPARAMASDLLKSAEA